MSPLNGMSQRRWSFSYNLSGCDSVALWGKSVVFCYIGIIHPRRNIFGRIYSLFSFTPQFLSVWEGRSQWHTVRGHFRFHREKLLRLMVVIFPHTSSPSSQPQA